MQSPANDLIEGCLLRCVRLSARIPAFAIGGTGAIVGRLSVKACMARRRRGTPMKLSRRKWLHLAAGAAALPALSGIARAQAYPTRAITLVAPFPAGGPVDTIARILAEHMRGSLGQPLLVENIAGAAGSLGVGRVARAAPDGYTLIVGQWSTHVANAAIYKLPYDTLADFAPIALLSNNPGLIVGRKDLPANNLKDLIAWLKANPEKATQCTLVAGGSGHIRGAFFQQVTGTNYYFVT